MSEKRMDLEAYRDYLWNQEKSKNTIEKYIRDVNTFLTFLNGKEIDRGQVISYKEHLTKTYKISSINSMIVALNNYLNFIGKNECCVKTCRVQRQIFREESRALSKEEYLRLLEAAEKEKKIRLSCVIQTIASTGIRVGELSYITVESLKRRMAEIRFKGKSRIILIPDSLVHVLKRYCREAGIVSGCIFVTRK